MKLRVAYDISFLAHFFRQPSAKSGIHRVVEQLLLELCKRDDVEITTMAICEQHPLQDAMEASSYFGELNDLEQCDFDPSLKGRFGFSPFHVRLFGRTSSNGRPASYRDSRAYLKAASLSARVALKIDHPRHYLKRDRYDVFHSPFFNLPSNDVVGNVPKLKTVYDLICQKKPEWMSSQVVSMAHEMFASIDFNRDWVTCISEFTRDEFCEYTGMSPDRVFVTPLAAADHFRPITDPQRLSAVRQQYEIPDGDYFLALGALQPRKNFTHLIRCFSQLLAERPNLEVNLVIVGATAWMYEEIFSTVSSSAELQKRIVLTGFVDDKDLSAIYSGATAFLFPSLYEGFGLPPLEAMQCGTPVIASNTTAVPEVVGDGGLLLDPCDADSWCQAMLDLLTNDELRRELTTRGLKRSTEFTWAKSADKTVAAYRIAAGF